MDNITTQQIIGLFLAETAGVIVALGGFARWMIRFHRQTIEKAVIDAATERAKLEKELRLQIRKLEAQNEELDTRLQACEKRWDDWLTTQAGK